MMPQFMHIDCSNTIGRNHSMVIPSLANQDLTPMITYTLLDAFPTNSRNIIGRNHSMVIPLLANQDLTPMLRSILYPHHGHRRTLNLGGS